ncbi:hypothetical protein C8F01DRAFT_1146843 [Mycena amicta]|nr:hypothetical protein C8F01DRAFT_1146843 [Mycena amicta]
MGACVTLVSQFICLVSSALRICTPEPCQWALRHASSVPMDPRVATHRCTSCKTYKAITRDNFAFRNSAFLRTCLKCQNRRRKTQLGGDGDDDGEADKENEPAADNDDSELTVIELEDFLAIIGMDESARSFSALVDTAKTGEKG